MPSGTKAILTQLAIQIADNNVRRNIGLFSSNVNNVNQDILQKTTIVLANGGTYTANLTAGNLITVVATNIPLSADVTLAGGGNFSKIITSLMVLDFEVTSILFTNNDAVNNATLVLISG